MKFKIYNFKTLKKIKRNSLFIHLSDICWAITVAIPALVCGFTVVLGNLLQVVDPFKLGLKMIDKKYAIYKKQT